MTDVHLPEGSLTDIQLAVLTENTRLSIRNGMMGLYVARLQAQSAMFKTLLGLGTLNRAQTEYYDWASGHSLIAAEVERPLAFAASTEGPRTVIGANKVDPMTNTTLRFSEVFIGELTAGALLPRPMAEYGFLMRHMIFALGRISIQSGADMQYCLSGNDWPVVP